ncbi:hypothetical protein MY5147_000761 [Beauveria neobassiana]
MRTVDGPMVYRHPLAFTVSMQRRPRDSKAGGDSDPEDLVSILAPETDGGDSNKIGYGAVNGFQDTEDDSIADFDVLLIVNVSSGSEESTDGEHNPGRDDDSDDDVGNVDEVTTGVGGGGTNREDGGNDRDEESDKEEDYVNAMYGFIPPEIEETEEGDELEPLFDDAMSRADEMKPGRLVNVGQS